MTTRDVPCPGCSPRPEGKRPPSFLQPSCPICNGRGVITQELEDPKVTWVLPSLAFGNLRAAESWKGVSICVNEKPWCCDHPNCQHLPVLDDFASDSFEAETDVQVKSRDAEIQGHETNPERLEAIARIYGHCLGTVPLLIHCTGGRERSVLATAYVLVTRHRFLWEPAYELLFSLNSGIFDRREWLDWELRERLEEIAP